MKSWPVPKRRDTLSRLVKDVVRRCKRVGVRRRAIVNCLQQAVARRLPMPLTEGRTSPEAEGCKARRNGTWR